ncbi:MAG: septal ring lytic transglycosylase RlpA family protein [Nitrospirota bacterium]|jgi:rare lipoprotein A
MRTLAGTYSKAGLFLFFAALVAACSTAPVRQGTRDLGVWTASWYGPGFDGNPTASGELYDMNALTCAHKSLPFGARLMVTSLRTGRSVQVVVNDRGPFVRGRDLDLSRAAAEEIGLIGPGTDRVRVVYVGRDLRYRKYIKGGVAGAEPFYDGPYTVQVGAFNERSNAARIKEGLEFNHKKVHVTVTWLDGRRFYRVRVGKFGSEQEALQYARGLADEGYDARIVPFESPI